MNKQSLKALIFCIIYLHPFFPLAQESKTSLKSYKRLVVENSWLNSENKAGGVFNTFIPDGVFILNAEKQNGDSFLSQLSRDKNEYGFNSKKIIRLKNIVFEGGISYFNQQQENVSWTARMDPTTNNPYMLADSMSGRYSKDYVNMFGSFGYSLNDRITFGINVDYLVGDGARIKDPRPVNNLFSLEIFPAFIYSFSTIKLGANLHLMMGREKISYTTIENSTTYRFFRFFGLGKGAKTTNGWSYTRNYYSSGIGGEIQADYRIGNSDIFNGLGFFSSKEKAEDGSSNPRKNDAGDYKESNIKFYIIINSEKTLIHTTKVNINLSFGEGIESIQEPYSEDNITYYKTIAEVSKYSSFGLNLGINYKLIKPYSNYLNKWELETSIEFDHNENEYILEANQTISNIVSTIRFDKSVFLNENQIVYGVNTSFVFNLSRELVQQRTYTALQEIAAWENIVYPDFLIQSANSYSMGLHIRYGRKLSIIKEKTSQIFIDLNTKFIFASNDEWFENKTREFYGIKLGITY